MITRTNSSAVSTASPGSQSSPSAGMQYVHRRLHLSVTDTRRSRTTRPYLSISPAPVTCAGAALTGGRRRIGSPSGVMDIGAR